MVGFYWLAVLVALVNHGNVLYAADAGQTSVPRIRDKSVTAAEIINERGIKTAVKERIANYDATKVPIAKRVLAIYHIGVLSLDYSYDVVINNLKIFSSAVLSHVDSTHAETLYMFNLVGGESNPFFSYVPCSSINTLCVSHALDTSDPEAVTDLDTHRDIVQVLGNDVLSAFKNVLFLNHEARGPFEKMENGEWLTMFTSLMDKPNKGVANAALLSSYGHHLVPIAAAYEANCTLSIGAVGVGISCEPEPRLLSHAFMVSSRYVVRAFKAVATASAGSSAAEDLQSGVNRAEVLGAALTMHLLRQGVTLASLVQMARFSPTSVRPDLAAQVANEFEQSNPAGEYVPHVLGESGSQASTGNGGHSGGSGATIGGVPGGIPVATGMGEKERDAEEPPEPAEGEGENAEDKDTIHDHAITRLRPMPEDAGQNQLHRRLSESQSQSQSQSQALPHNQGQGQGQTTGGSSDKQPSLAATKPPTAKPLSPKSGGPKSVPSSAGTPPPLVDAVDRAIYKNKCLAASSNVRVTTNPVMWCNLLPSEMLFVRYGGAILRTPGILCEDTVKAVTEATIALVGKLPTLRLRLPENPYGGVFRDLYAQYSRELWQWQHAEKYKAALQKAPTKQVASSTSSTSSSKGQKGSSSSHHHHQRQLGSNKHHHSSHHRDKDKDKAHATAVVPGHPEPSVCFLVRSAHVHTLKQVPGKPPSRLVKMDLKLLIQTLVRQVNPHWHAYFLITDEKPFEEELTQILGGFNDPRLHFLDIPMDYRPPFTVIDAGYTATDYGLRILFAKPECRYISVTNADNAYGSHIVESVLNARVNVVTGKPADMLLAPLDSRNFAESDYRLRARLRGGKAGGWRERCVGVETSLKLQGFVYTIQTLPILGRVDLAAVFFDAAKWRDEHLLFGNFSDVNKYSCKGCQDGYLTESLVTQRYWSYVQLPIDGMRSMVFHGPSPTLCIASGNVWFDFPEVNKLGCVSHRTVGTLHASPFYDLGRFYETKSPRVCLRLSQKGFWNRTASIIT